MQQRQGWGKGNWTHGKTRALRRRRRCMKAARTALRGRSKVIIKYRSVVPQIPVVEGAYRGSAYKGVY